LCQRLSQAHLVAFGEHATGNMSRTKSLSRLTKQNYSRLRITVSVVQILPTLCIAATAPWYHATVRRARLGHTRRYQCHGHFVGRTVAHDNRRRRGSRRRSHQCQYGLGTVRRKIAKFRRAPQNNVQEGISRVIFVSTFPRCVGNHCTMRTRT
jgi:hypothetical protein